MTPRKQVKPTAPAASGKSRPVHRRPSLQVVALTSLSREQMLEFARKKQVENAKALIDEIEKKDATEFASRPQDLQDLIDYWEEHKRIGRRLE